MIASVRTEGAHALSLLMLLVLGTNWGLGFTLGKVGVTGGLHPLAYAFWQCLGGGLVLLAICAWRNLLPPVRFTHLRYYLICGATNVAMPNFVALTAAQHIPVGIIVLIISLAPLLTYAVALGFGLERFTPRRVGGLALGLAGALMILVPKSSLPSPDAAPWVMFALLTPLCYGISNVYLGWARPADVPSLSLGSAMQIAAGLVLLPLALLVGTMHVPLPPQTNAEIANVSHIAVSGFGALIFFELMRMRGAVVASQVGYIVCLSGVFWGKLFFGEQHSFWVWMAMATIFTGLALVTWPARKPATA
jgi:drug/metabolite transporter (DMT)-like permease